jgi:hypothetical protein
MNSTYFFFAAFAILGFLTTWCKFKRTSTARKSADACRTQSSFPRRASRRSKRPTHCLETSRPRKTSRLPSAFSKSSASTTSTSRRLYNQKGMVQRRESARVFIIFAQERHVLGLSCFHLYQCIVVLSQKMRPKLCRLKLACSDIITESHESLSLLDIIKA